MERPLLVHTPSQLNYIGCWVERTLIQAHDDSKDTLLMKQSMSPCATVSYRSEWRHWRQENNEVFISRLATRKITRSLCVQHSILRLEVGCNILVAALPVLSLATNRLKVNISILHQRVSDANPKFGL